MRILLMRMIMRIADTGAVESTLLCACIGGVYQSHSITHVCSSGDRRVLTAPERIVYSCIH
jgi:hypothetical protein